MKKISLLLTFFFFTAVSFAQKDSTVTKKDRKKDVLMQTTMGDMTIRLSDSTPLHRDNFLKLVKVGFYDSLLFHRVMNGFMIQGGDPASKNAATGIQLGGGGPGYTIPAEFRKTFFHKKGVIAAARQPDYANAEKASNGSQFYLAQGKVFTDTELDMMETQRLQGRKIPSAFRELYKIIGGAPHLDGDYTVYGELVNGIEIIDKIASVKTNSSNRPLEDVRIIKARLIKRKKK